MKNEGLKMDNTWIIEVLADLRTFCSSNGELRLAECLAQIEQIAHEELSGKDRSVPSPGRLDCIK